MDDAATHAKESLRQHRTILRLVDALVQVVLSELPLDVRKKLREVGTSEDKWFPAFVTSRPLMRTQMANRILAWVNNRLGVVPAEQVGDLAVQANDLSRRDNRVVTLADRALARVEAQPVVEARKTKQVVMAIDLKGNTVGVLAAEQYVGMDEAWPHGWQHLKEAKVTFDQVTLGVSAAIADVMLARHEPTPAEPKSESAIWRCLECGFHLGKNHSPACGMRAIGAPAVMPEDCVKSPDDAEVTQQCLECGRGVGSDHKPDCRKHYGTHSGVVPEDCVEPPAEVKAEEADETDHRRCSMCHRGIGVYHDENCQRYNRRSPYVVESQCDQRRCILCDRQLHRSHAADCTARTVGGIYMVQKMNCRPGKQQS
jgi:hypothetical protein